MSSLTKVSLFFLLLLLAGASAVNQLAPGSEAVLPEEESANVNEVAQTSVGDTSIIKYIDKGEMRASWYGPGFHGNLTANGEVYDQEALTVAHKYFRFGTLLRLTNPENGKSVIVRVNDRGPYIQYRQLDVSKAAARELGMIWKGVTKLKVEQVTLQGVNFPVIQFN